jgi:hypothetical protein
VATEAAWLEEKCVASEKSSGKDKKLLTGIGLLMEGVDHYPAVEL